MEKRLILAIALCMFVILAFQYFGPRPPAPTVPVTATVAAPASPVGTAAELTPYEPSKVSFAERSMDAEMGGYKLVFSNVGGSIKSIELKDYKDLASGQPLMLANIKNPKEYIGAIASLTTKTPLDLSEYKIKVNGGNIECYLQTGDLEITKQYILHNSNRGIELRIYIKNLSTEPKRFSYSIIGGAGVNETQAADKRLVEVTSKTNGNRVNFKAPRKGRITIPGDVEWSALKNKYFSIILKPMVPTNGQFYGENRDNELSMGIETRSTTISPGTTLENKFLIYVGPSHIPALKKFGYGLEETMNYGFFGGISKLILIILGFFYSIFRNWGVAIILLSVFLNIVLFPFSAKSFKSIKKMQDLHPEMEKLKKEFKDNPQKQNKAMMELYKKYNINPMGGCLPMILQMPVFFALYQALLKSIELRSAQFLWIKDLSSPDAVKIPFTLPLVGNSINILPLIMVAAMVMQQKMSTSSMGAAVTEEQKQQQKMMLILTPVLFGFIFYSMPSGLVLYWVVNTVLTIGEQSYIFKKA